MNRDHWALGVLVACGTLATLAAPAQAGLAIGDTTIFNDMSPANIVLFIKAHGDAELQTWLLARTPGERKQFLDAVRITMQQRTIPYGDIDIDKLEFMADAYDPEAILLDIFLRPELLAKNKSCHSSGGGVDEKCWRLRDGAAFAHWSRTNRYACWETLKTSKGKLKEFRQAVRSYYKQQSGDDDKDLSQCDAPAEPPRCKLASCTYNYERGVAFRALTDLGIALPIGTPTFGFKPGDSAQLQATVGVAVRGFIYDGRLDFRVGLGIANAVGADGMTSTPAFAWTLQIGAFELLSVGFLGLTNPKNAATGKAFTISVDLAGIKDQLSK